MSVLANIAANVIAVAHLAYFVFIVAGMVAIVLSSRRDVRWVRNPWFRIAHVAAIYVVLVEEASRSAKLHSVFDQSGSRR